MKKSILCFLFAAASIAAVSACNKFQPVATNNKEAAVNALARKEVTPFAGTSKIVYKNYDGKELKTVYSTGSYSYADEIPSRKSSSRYDYTFSGWHLTKVEGCNETIATATFDSTLRKYTVRFVDGDKVVSTEEVAYGKLPKVPEGFETAEKVKEVFSNKTYFKKIKGKGEVYSEGLIFQLLDEKSEWAVEDYYGIDDDVIIPSTYNGLPVTTILRDAFAHSVAAIKTIYIPNSIYKIEENAFRGIDALNSINLQDGNPTYRLDSMGALAWDDVWYPGEEYEEVYSHLLYVPSGKVDLLEIPKEAYNFFDDGALNRTNATILKISLWPFLSMLDLFGGDYHNNVKQIIGTEGDMRENFCEGMTELYSFTMLEDDDEYAGDFVGKAAFKGCTNLRGISLPSQYIEIGDEAFMNCTSLEDVVLGFGTLSINRFGKNVFTNCPNIIGYDLDGVTYLGNKTYKYQIPVRVNDDLAKYQYFPAEMLLIPDELFKNNQVLTGVDFSKCNRLISIGDRAFFQCSNLKIGEGNTVVVPSTLTYFGYQSFASTKFSLDETVYLATRVESKNESYALVHLAKGTDTFEIDRYVTFLDPYGLRYGFNKVTLNANNSVFKIFQSKILTHSFIVDHVARGMESVTNITYTSYFAYVAPYCAYEVPLTKFVMLSVDDNISDRSSLTKIGAYAFYRCKFKSNLRLGDYLETIEDHAFYFGIDAAVTLNVRSRLVNVGKEAFQANYGFTLKFEADQLPKGWDDNFDGANGQNEKNSYQFSAI